MENDKQLKTKTTKFKNNSPSKSKKRKSKGTELNSDKTFEKMVKNKSTLKDDVMFLNLELSNDIKLILIKEAFRMFDTDESGYIDKKEFRNLIQSLGMEMNVKKIDELMRNVDKDGSGTIDIEEFTNMMLKYQFNEETAISTHLDSAFNLYDKDDDGIISEEDLLKVALELDEDIKQDEAMIIINLAKSLMQEIETNLEQGENDVVGISKKEFINLLLKTKFLTDLNSSNRLDSHRNQTSDRDKERDKDKNTTSQKFINPTNSEHLSKNIELNASFKNNSSNNDKSVRSKSEGGRSDD